MTDPTAERIASECHFKWAKGEGHADNKYGGVCLVCFTTALDEARREGKCEGLEEATQYILENCKHDDGKCRYGLELRRRSLAHYA